MVTNATERVTCDGGEMSLKVWKPDGARRGVLVLQEIFGVGAYIEAVCTRLAAAGYVAAAPDVFWRFSPGWAAGHDQAGLEASLDKVQQLDVPGAITDCAAALEHLSDATGSPAAVLGFCLGGTLAWGVADQGSPAACVSYYGSGVPAMLGVIDRVTCPTLFHFGADDPYISSDAIDAVAAAVLGREGFVLNVEHAGHAFDNHESEMFWNEAAASAAWSKTMAFLAEHHAP